MNASATNTLDMQTGPARTDDGRPETDVLVCGAGPTGLMLALRLRRAGVRVRIFDLATEPGTTSRALVVHARTLEFYRQIGLADALAQEGLPFEAANFWLRARRVAHVEFRAMGEGLTAFPHMLVVPQDRHERFLIQQLRRAGVEVERGIRLVDFTETSDRLRARLAHPDGREFTCEASYLAGCDGARSRTREVIDAGFPGRTYSHIFFVADVETRGTELNGELSIALDDSNILGVFPLRGGHTARLIGTVLLADEHDGSKLTWDDVGKQSVERLGIQVERVNWFSTYRVHHRVAGRFRRGRAFLCGDAGHIHSPVGAQGMNTGIGDAVNLAWKLADVLHGRARAELLDSYEPERLAFARKLVATTDRAFVFAMSRGPVARFVRHTVLPLVLPALFKSKRVRRFQFRVLSQTSIHYRECAFNRGSAGKVHGGDRLPWTRVGASDNYASMDALSWSVDVYGSASRELTETCQQLGIALRAFPWDARMQRVGLARDAVYLVRPDAHVAWAGRATQVRELESFVTALRGPAAVNVARS